MTKNIQKASFFVKPLVIAIAILMSGCMTQSKWTRIGNREGWIKEQTIVKVDTLLDTVMVYKPEYRVDTSFVEKRDTFRITIDKPGATIYIARQGDHYDVEAVCKEDSLKAIIKSLRYTIEKQTSIKECTEPSFFSSVKQSLIWIFWICLVVGGAVVISRGLNLIKRK